MRLTEGNEDNKEGAKPRIPLAAVVRTWGHAGNPLKRTFPSNLRFLRYLL